MKAYWLCKDVRGFSECDRCLRNPERPENVMSALEPGQPMLIPMASEHACADVKPTADCER